MIERCGVAEFLHKPVMMAEVLAAIQPKPGGLYADGTLGGAGHATAVLAASSPSGRLMACDRDGVALEAATKRLAELRDQNKKLRDNLAMLRSPAMLEQRMNKLNLGMVMPQAKDVWRVAEPLARPVSVTARTASVQQVASR